MRHTKETTLQRVRKPTPAEAKRGADVVFERSGGHVILACRCYEAWEQWGAPQDVLCDNVDAVEQWRRNGLAAFDESLQGIYGEIPR